MYWSKNANCHCGSARFACRLLGKGAIVSDIHAKSCSPFTELDPWFNKRRVLLALRRNGADLDAKTGPLRLVIPEEKRHARWMRQMNELEIVRVSGGKT